MMLCAGTRSEKQSPCWLPVGMQPAAWCQGKSCVAVQYAWSSCMHGACVRVTRAHMGQTKMTHILMSLHSMASLKFALG